MANNTDEDAALSTLETIRAHVQAGIGMAREGMQQAERAGREDLEQFFGAYLEVSLVRLERAGDLSMSRESMMPKRQSVPEPVEP